MANLTRPSGTKLPLLCAISLNGACTTIMARDEDNEDEDLDDDADLDQDPEDEDQDLNLKVQRDCINGRYENPKLWPLRA
jgi:hypothetical protein